jgi:hypothetical protein
MGVLDFRDAYEFDPEAYGGEGGGLPGRLRRYAQEYGIDLGPTSSGAPKYNPDSYNSPQGGLPGRLLALQAQQSQYQPVGGNGGQAPSAPQNPNFTPVPQTPITAPPLDTYSLHDPETYVGEGVGLPRHGIDLGSSRGGEIEYNPERYGSPQGGLLGRLQALQAEQSQYQPIPEPAHALTDRLLEYWEHPDPHGLVAILKAGRNGANQAVQGSTRPARHRLKRRRFDKTWGVNSAQ